MYLQFIIISGEDVEDGDGEMAGNIIQQIRCFTHFIKYFISLNRVTCFKITICYMFVSWPLELVYICLRVPL